MREKYEQVVVASLIRDGRAWVAHENPLLQEQSALNLFSDVGAELQEMLGDEAFSVELEEQDSGLLFTLKVGDAANEPPDFSPPEPRLL